MRCYSMGIARAAASSAKCAVGGMFAMALAAGAAHADDIGWYGGGAIGVSDVAVPKSLWRDGPALTNAKNDTLGVAYQFYGGYRLHRHLGIEVGMNGYGDTRFSARSSGINTIWNAGLAEGRTEVSGVSAALVAFWPGDERRMQYYGKAGILFFTSSAKYDSTINDINHFNDDGGLPLFALGVQYRAWGRWSLRGEWQYTQATIANRQNAEINFLSIGLMHPLP